MTTSKKIAVILLNWNGVKDSLTCIEALKKQTIQHIIIAVDNGSTDSFAEKMRSEPDIVLIENEQNLGFSGGMNTGLRYALEQKFKYIALVNNDAVPEKTWLEETLAIIEKDNTIGIVDSLVLSTDGYVDSAGICYSDWGISFPRHRGKSPEKTKFTIEEVFAASGAAPLYRSAVLLDVGLFDEDFFMYYEDVDLSFRARLGGWKIMFAPNALVHHKIGASSSRVSGLTTYHAIKNQPWVFWKNVPLRLMPRMLPRFLLFYTSLIASNILKRKFAPVTKGFIVSSILLPKKLIQRWFIQNKRVASPDCIKSIITYSPPPQTRKQK